MTAVEAEEAVETSVSIERMEAGLGFFWDGEKVHFDDGITLVFMASLEVAGCVCGGWWCFAKIETWPSYLARQEGEGGICTH